MPLEVDTELVSRRVKCVVFVEEICTVTFHALSTNIYGPLAREKMKKDAFMENPRNNMYIFDLFIKRESSDILFAATLADADKYIQG